MARLTPEQVENTRAIIRVGRAMGLSDAFIIMGLAVAKAESGMRNLNFGDRDSVGLFQQRPSQGWGSVQQIMNPEYSARKFFEAAQATARAHPNAPTSEIAWRTQRPATRYRGIYASNMQWATEAFQQETGQAGVSGPFEIGTADGGAGFNGARGYMRGGAEIGGAPPVMLGGHDGGFARFPELNPNGVLADVKFHGLPGVEAHVSEAIIGTPTIELTSSEVSQFTLTVEDPKFDLLRQGAFMLHGAMEFADLKFEIASVATGGGDGPTQVSIEARTFGVQQLKRQTGALIVQNVSPSSFVNYMAGSVGLRFVGEDSAVRPHITRQADDPATTRDDAENTWDVFQRLASEIGFICFETAGTVFFGKPVWIMIRPNNRAHVVRWPQAHSASEITPVEVPVCRRSENANNPVTVELVLDRQDALGIRPGDRLELRDLYYFHGDYLITSVSIPVDGRSTVSVSATTPIDPEPAAPEAVDQPGELGAPFDDATRARLDAVGTADGGAGQNGASQASGGEGYIWPVEGTVTSEFGPRNGRNHDGIDIGAPSGRIINAARGGTIIRKGWRGGYGNAIEIDHGGGVTTLYAHQSRFAGHNVGQRVERGQTIGYVGSTGNSTGPHLHFEVRISGVPKNPRGYLPAGGNPGNRQGRAI